MFVTDSKLIQGLVENLEQLAALNKDAKAQAVIHASRSMLYELNRRADFEKSDSYFRNGRALLAAAAGADCPPDKAAKINQTLAVLPEHLPPECNSISGNGLIDKLRQSLHLLIDDSHYPFMTSKSASAAIAELIAWELESYHQQAPEIRHANDQAKGLTQDHEKPIAVDAAFLERYMREHCAGFEDAVVTQCNPVPGGFSKQTVLFDVETKASVEKFAYRGTQKNQLLDRVMVSIENEFQVVKHAFNHGAIVAEPLWLQTDPALNGAQFFISRRLTGSNLGTAIQAHQEISRAATQSLARVLATIHRLPLDISGPALKHFNFQQSGSAASLPDTIRKRIHHWRDYWKLLDCGVYPILDLSLQWLLDNVSEADDEPVLVHGDYGLHNILIDADQVTAALDWEACYIGDRAHDLSHLFAGTAEKMDRVLFMQTYIEAGGKTVSEFRLNYYQVMMTMQFMMCTVQAQMFYQQRPGAGTNFCTLGLGFIHHTAKTINEGILKASAAKQH